MRRYLTLILFILFISSVNALVFTVEESELVKLKLDAYDPDGKELTYIYSSPLDENGEWQTEIGDAGTYNILVTVSDGEKVTKQGFTLIINEKEEVEEEELIEELEEIIEESEWEEEIFEEEIVEEVIEEIIEEKIKKEINFEKINNVILDENSEVNLELTASIEGGTIEYFAENMPEGATLSGNVFHFKPDYEYVKRNFFLKFLNKVYTYAPKKSKTVTFIAKSDDNEKRQNVKITVKDVNRKPTLEIEDITVMEEEKIKFNPIVNDEDGDWLKIKYSGDIKNNYLTNIDDFGEYKVKVIVSDPFSSVEKDFNVVVKNKNREPIIKELPFSKVNEGEKLTIKLDAFDIDDDELSYYIVEGPGSVNNDVYEFTPGFDFVKKKDEIDLISKIKYFNKENKQNKEITVTLGVSDGNLTDESSFKIIVNDINQKPEIINFEPEDYIIVAKNARIIFSVDANDLDNDELIYEWDFGIFNKLEAENKIARTFTTKGIKKIKVKISDGVDEVEKVWKVRVI